MYTRDVIGTRNLLVIINCPVCSDVCSLVHCVASWIATPPLDHLWCGCLTFLLPVASGRGPPHIVSSSRSYYVLILGSSHSLVYDGETVSHTRFPCMQLVLYNFNFDHFMKSMKSCNDRSCCCWVRNMTRLANTHNTARRRFGESNPRPSGL